MLVIGPQWLPFEGSWTRSGLRGGYFSCKHKSICRGRRCGGAQRSMPRWGIEPHERAGFGRQAPTPRTDRYGIGPYDRKATRQQSP